MVKLHSLHNEFITLNTHIALKAHTYWIGVHVLVEQRVVITVQCLAYDNIYSHLSRQSQFFQPPASATTQYITVHTVADLRQWIQYAPNLLLTLTRNSTRIYPTLRQYRRAKRHLSLRATAVEIEPWPCDELFAQCLSCLPDC